MDLKTKEDVPEVIQKCEDALNTKTLCEKVFPSDVTNDIQSMPPPPTENITYYAVYVANRIPGQPSAKEHVYTDKKIALEQFGKIRDARFKAFPNREEANHFAMQGPSLLNISKDVDSGRKSAPASLCRSITSQEYVIFRKCIEKGQVKSFSEMIVKNARYLVSKADTPAILKEGSRYNALHVACLYNQPQICEEILTEISKSSLFLRLYPDDPPQSTERRIAFLLDLYLNTPDKGSNRTPLHHAVVKGYIECVKVLISYPGCNKNAVDRFGKTPFESICVRSTDNNPELKKKIEALVGEQFYVPLFKDEENCFSPKVGAPMSPNHNGPAAELIGLNSPHNGPMNPIYRVQGYVGPMSGVQSKEFYEKWKPAITSSPIRTPKKNMSMNDSIESVGRKLAADWSIPFTEYWAFLGEFVDISSLEGLEMLEAHLAAKLKEIIDQKLNAIEEEKSLEGNSLDTCSVVSLHEDDSTQVSNVSSIGMLCHELEALRLNGSFSSPSARHPLSQLLVNAVQKPDANNCDDNKMVDLPLETDEFSAYNYAFQSACVAGMKMASVVSGFVDLFSLGGYEYATLQSFHEKLRPEVTCLQNVLKRMTPHQTINLNFVHPIAVTKALEDIVENLVADDIWKLSQGLDAMHASLQFLQEDSYESEEALPDTKPERCPHASCVITLFKVGLQKAYQISNSSTQTVINWTEIGQCQCVWWTGNDSEDPIACPLSPSNPPKDTTAQIILHRFLYGPQTHIDNTNNNSSLKSDTKSDGDDELYMSAKSSMGEDSMATAEELTPVYINGSLPTDEDFEVFESLANAEVCAKSFPAVCEWRTSVSKCSKEKTDRLTNRSETSFRNTSLPFSPLSEGPMRCLTPDRLRRSFQTQFMHSPIKKLF